MKKKPYTYSMPESFMLDNSVPAHWRMLGILNGFWINHHKVYATNAWFAEELRCSERTITDAVVKLEELGIAYCERTGKSRIILPRSQLLPTSQPTATLGSNQLLPTSQPTATLGSNQLLHNSDSNSDSIKKDFSEDEKITIEDIEGQLIDEDGNPILDRRAKSNKVPRERKNEVALRILSEFRRRCKKELGTEPVHGIKEYTIVLFALSSGNLTEQKIHTLFDDWFSSGKSDEDTIQVTRALSKVQINNFKLHER